MAFFERWTTNPTSEQGNVSTGLGFLTGTLSIFTTPTFEFGTRVDWILDSVTIDTDVSVNPVAHTGGFGTLPNKTVKAEISPALADDTYFSFSFTITGRYYPSDDPLAFTSPTIEFTTADEFAAAPILTEPADEETGVTLNPLLLKRMAWEDGEETDVDPYTMHFSVDGGSVFVPEDSRIRYSILALRMNLGVHLDYETTYYWFVRKDLGGGSFIDSEISSFTTMAYAPPAPSTRTRPPYEGGADITVPTGENNMITVQRLIAIGRNKFFYEDV